MAAEFIKSCCKGCLHGEKDKDLKITKEQEANASKNAQHVIEKPPLPSIRQKGQIGCAEDYLLSKIPPDGREVPFMVPTLKASYIQPRTPWNPNFPDGLEGSAITAFNDRKAELSCYYQSGPDSEVVYSPGYILQQVSPRPLRHIQQSDKTMRLYDSSWDLRTKKPPLSPGLSNSMFELNSSHRYIQRYDSVSSVQSSASSLKDSQGSTPSLVTSSGDERELGKLNLRLCYNPSLEQIWITIVQCKDLNLPSKCGEHPSVCIKGIITLPKAIQFKSSVKEGSDIEFMETFVFSIKLNKLQTVALVFRIQTQTPRKRTVGECSLSLRDLNSTESEHWLDITSLTKASTCHAELQIATCFQPVNNRIQLQILEAQNLPSSATPLSISFFVKVEMYSTDGSTEKKKTRSLKSTNGQVKWADAMLFPLETQKVQGITFIIKLYSRSSMRRKHYLGQVLLGWESISTEAADQWKDSLTNPEKVVTKWHKLN